MSKHTIVTSKEYKKKILIGRCNRNQQKEHALTGGDLQCYELAMKKSAEVIVLIDTSCVKINKNTDGLTKGGRTERKFSGNKLENVST